MLKCRNAVIFKPSTQASECATEAVNMMRRGLGEKTDQFAFQSLQPAIKIQGKVTGCFNQCFLYTPRV